MLKRRKGCYWRGLGVDSRAVSKDKEGPLTQVGGTGSGPLEEHGSSPGARSWWVVVPNGTRWKSGF